MAVALTDSVAGLAAGTGARSSFHPDEWAVSAPLAAQVELSHLPRGSDAALALTPVPWSHATLFGAWPSCAPEDSWQRDAHTVGTRGR